MINQHVKKDGTACGLPEVISVEDMRNGYGVSCSDAMIRELNLSELLDENGGVIGIKVYYETVVD